MSTPLHFGPIGCGRISKRHTGLLGNSQSTNAKLAAVFDVKVARAEAIGKQFSVPANGDRYMAQRIARALESVVIS